MKSFRLIALTALFCAAPTFAGIVGTGGPTQLIANPVNQRYGPDAYNIDIALYWPERANQTLASDLVVSILPPPTFPTDTVHVNDNSLSVPQGTVVDSYFIVWDPQGGSVVASFHFDDTIVGLITNSRDNNPVDDHFILSDFLTDPAVPAANLPPGHFDARGIEPGNGDFIRWLSPKDIELHIGASIPGDHIRVITSRGVPEPASLALLAFSAAALNRRRMRIRR